MVKKPRIIKNARELAVHCMLEVTREDLLVPEAMSRLAADLDDQDRAFATKLVYDGFRYLPGLDRVLRQFCKPGKMPKPIYWLLITSVCQIIYTRTPDYAVVNEANKLASQMGFRGLKGLVNGVLRNVMREGPHAWESLTSEDWLLPPWLGELLKKQYSSEQLNLWLKEWSGKGCISYWSATGKPITEDPASQCLPHSRRRETPLTPEVMEARGIYVQNETSQAVAEAVCRSSVKSVLDVCAAPGGKSFYLAAFAKLDRHLACDASRKRMARLQENKNRLGLTLETRIARAQDLEPGGETFDLVIVDAPCSGIGIIGRHPEIKTLKKQPADDPLKLAQSQILQQSWQHVKPGGYLLYTVCSLDRTERPSLPEGAVAVPQTMADWMPDKVPIHIDQSGFSIPPSPVFDGFLGMLLQKPTG